MTSSISQKILVVLMTLMFLAAVVNAQASGSGASGSSGQTTTTTTTTTEVPGTSTSTSTTTSTSAPTTTTTTRLPTTSTTAKPTVCLVKYCTACLTGSQVSCAVCNSDYKLNVNNGYCVPKCRVNNCLKCQSTNNKWCLNCAKGYTRLDTGLCGYKRSTIIIQSGAAAPVSLCVAVSATVLAAIALML